MTTENATSRAFGYVGLPDLRGESLDTIVPIITDKIDEIGISESRLRGEVERNRQESVQRIAEVQAGLTEKLVDQERKHSSRFEQMENEARANTRRSLRAGCIFAVWGLVGFVMSTGSPELQGHYLSLPIQTPLSTERWSKVRLFLPEGRSQNVE